MRGSRKYGNYRNARGQEMFSLRHMDHLDTKQTVPVVQWRFVFKYALSCIIEFGPCSVSKYRMAHHIGIMPTYISLMYLFRSARRRSRVRPTSTASRTSPAAGRAPGSSRSNQMLKQQNNPTRPPSLEDLLIFCLVLL